MKNFILLFAFFLGGETVTRAQNEQPSDDTKKQERIEALYVAYISRQLELSPEEAQKFWPMHTQFEAEVKAVRRDLPELDKQQAILNVKKKYQNSFNSIVGPKRCERFFHMDGEFKRKLLDRIKTPKQNQAIRPRMRARV